ncbi:carbohydrate ABC transporter permease [Nonomuraea fuscirosea]|uniref:carbohydrate ABC transporter permease n=1 Tax=Nonomuraea fuscirosea TaxID=1291556 RepID=UPI0033D4E3BA
MAVLIREHTTVHRVQGPTITRQRRRAFLILALPAVILYTIFFVGPTLASFWVSLHAWDGVTEMRWRGLDNFTLLFEDEVFLAAFRNTLAILLAGGLLVFLLSFALLLGMRAMAGRRFARSVVFFPNIIAPIVLSVLWGFLFSTDGLVNAALGGVGLDAPNWLGDHLFLVIFLGLIWTNTGFYVTILMAATDRIPRYFYEAAELDGAGPLQQFRHITMPLSWDVVSTAAVIWTISSLKVFDFIYAFGGTSNDLPPIHTWNTAVFIYGQTFGGRVPAYSFGYASASAVITLVSVIVFVLLLRRVMRRDPIQF